jgi:hypothetical protein
MWTILRSIKCWEKYQQETAQSMGVQGMPIAWGNGPKEYPALVCTYMPPPQQGQPPKLVSAYVYLSDAEALMLAAGVKVAKPVPVQPIGPTTQVLTSDIPHQGDFNRWVTAYLLALTREMRDVGALKADRFEQSLAQSLQLVDEVATEKKDAILSKLEKQDRDILDRLRRLE